MAQKRPPPAYQEYAASMLASVDFRTMTLAERGLLYTLRLECWENGSVPRDPEILAKILGYSTDQISTCLLRIMNYFAVENGLIICPELEDYRNHLVEIRQKQSRGGKRGANTTNGNRRAMAVTGNRATEATSRVTRDSLVQHSTDKNSPTAVQSVETGVEVGDGQDCCEAYKKWMRPDSSNVTDRQSR